MNHGNLLSAGLSYLWVIPSTMSFQCDLVSLEITGVLRNVGFVCGMLLTHHISHGRSNVVQDPEGNKRTRTKRLGVRGPRFND